MNYRRILAPVFGIPGDTALLGHAIALARYCGARLDALTVMPDAARQVPLIGDGISAGVIEQIIAASREDIQHRIGFAEQTIRKSRDAAPDLVFEKIDVTGALDQILLDHGRFADLIMLAIPPLAGPIDYQAELETVLLYGATPLYLVPSADEGSGSAELQPAAPRRISIAYNGSLPAIRAVQMAMPLLLEAEAVEVLTLSTEKTSPELGRRLARHLERHDVRARSVTIDRDGSVGASLLAAAKGLDCQLLVMGGYGSSRLREFILGGVTRHAFKEARMPLLMAR